MKRAIAVLLVLFMFTGLCACTQEKDIVYPIAYHYLRVPQANGEIAHGSADSLIGSEVREGDGYQDNLTLLLDVYLHGPLDKDFRSPFPVGTALRSLNLQDQTAAVMISSHLATLTGVDLTVACGCLALTVMDLTGASTVIITAENALLDGKESVTMDRNNLVLIDNTNPEFN